MSVWEVLYVWAGGVQLQGGKEQEWYGGEVRTGNAAVGKHYSTWFIIRNSITAINKVTSRMAFLKHKKCNNYPSITCWMLMAKLLSENWDRKQMGGDQMVRLAEPESASQQVLGEEEGWKGKQRGWLSIIQAGRLLTSLPITLHKPALQAVMCCPLPTRMTS